MFGGFDFMNGMGGMGGGGSRDTKLYDLLRVKPTASENEIKAQYKKLAREFHPDKNPADGEKFKEITYAYEILNDPQKRAMYDRVGLDGLKEGGGGHSHEDLLEQMMGGGGLGGGLFGSLFGGGGQRMQRGPRRGQNTIHPLKVSLEELYLGKTAKLQLSKQVICKSCNGKGGRAGAVEVCRQCHGQRMIFVQRQLGPGMIQQMRQACPSCGGEGETIAEKDKCNKCSGKKTVQESKLLEVNVMPGSVHGQKITLHGEGDQQPGYEIGDVIIVLDEKSHELFKRQGEDLHLKKSVGLNEALTGFTFTISHLDGREVALTVAQGDILSPDCKRVVNGLGMPKKRDHTTFGDLYVHFDIEFPEHLDEETVKKLAKLLPPPPAQTKQSSSANHVDDIEEVTLQPFEQRHFVGQQGGKNATDSDDEDGGHGMHGGGQRVQCAQQ